MRINKILTFLLIITAAFVLCGCGFHKNQNHAVSNKTQIVLDDEQVQNAKIKTEVLQDRLVQLKITIPAQFKAMHKKLDMIYAPIDGKVVNVFVEIGDFVKKGQALISVKSDAIGQIQLEFLDKYIGVDSMIKQMSAQYNLSVQNYKRENTLYKEGISSRMEYEVARAQMLKDKANLDSLKIQRSALVQVYAQRVALYGGNESTITKAIATRKIYPFIILCANKTGVVLERKVNPGEIINQNREMLHVADLSTIWLIGYAFEKDAPLLRVGQSVEGVFEDTHSETGINVHKDIVLGKLSYVASILDTEKKTLEVIADIPNENFAIKPNMYAEMVVNVGQVEALAVPNSALQKYGDYTFAYVEIKPHVYEERRVEIGQHNDRYTQVKSGLKKGEIVVSQGGFSLLGESIKQKEE